MIAKYSRERVAGVKIVPMPMSEMMQLGQKIANWRAEEALIGAVLIEASIYTDLAGTVEPTDFFGLFHGYCWHAFEACEAADDPITVETVSKRLLEAHAPVPKLSGGSSDSMDALIAQLTVTMGACDGAQYAEHYAKEIRNAALCFRLLRATEAIQALVAQPELRSLPETLIDEANRILFVATEQRIEARADFSSSVASYREKMSVARSEHTALYVPTGYAHLDERVRFIVPGEVSAIAGAEGMGKTTWLLNLIYNLLQRIPVVLFTLEMTKEEVIRVFAAIKSGISKDDLRTGNLTDFEFKVFQEITLELETLPLIIFDKLEYPTLNPLQLRRKLRKLFQKEVLPFVAIDGLWLMESEKEELKNPSVRNRAVFEITRSLSDIATKFQTHICYMHQYNGAAENRGKKERRPILKDLAESAGTRRNTQTVLGLYRAAYYGLKAPFDVTELLVLKDRNGNSDVRERFDFWFDKRSSRYQEQP